MSKAAEKVGEQEVTMDRRRDERRDETSEVAGEGQPRRKKQRRRQIDPTTCERDYNDKEIEFMHALDEYKRNAGRMFPTCSEILEVIRDLGYVQLTEEQRASLQTDEFEDTDEDYTGDEESEEAEFEAIGDEA